MRNEQNPHATISADVKLDPGRLWPPGPVPVATCENKAKTSSHWAIAEESAVSLEKPKWTERNRTGFAGAAAIQDLRLGRMNDSAPSVSIFTKTGPSTLAADRTISNGTQSTSKTYL